MPGVGSSDVQEGPMASDRRSFLQSLVALPGVGGVLGGLLPTSLAAKPAKREIYKELGLRPLINAADTYTTLSASLLPKGALEAVEAAARQYVNIPELQDVVGTKPAALIRS